MVPSSFSGSSLKMDVGRLIGGYRTAGDAQAWAHGGTQQQRPITWTPMLVRQVTGDTFLHVKLFATGCVSA